MTLKIKTIMVNTNTNTNNNAPTTTAAATTTTTTTTSTTTWYPVFSFEIFFRVVVQSIWQTRATHSSLLSFLNVPHLCP